MASDPLLDLQGNLSEIQGWTRATYSFWPVKPTAKLPGMVRSSDASAKRGSILLFGILSPGI